MATRIEKLEQIVNPRSLTESERPWIEKWGPRARADLEARMAAAGYTRRVTWGVADYLAARARGAPADIISAPPRARYRKVLAELGAPLGGDPLAADNDRYVKLSSAAVQNPARGRRRCPPPA